MTSLSLTLSPYFNYSGHNYCIIVFVDPQALQLFESTVPVLLIPALTIIVHDVDEGALLLYLE